MEPAHTQSSRCCCTSKSTVQWAAMPKKEEPPTVSLFPNPPINAAQTEQNNSSEPKKDFRCRTHADSLQGKKGRGGQRLSFLKRTPCAHCQRHTRCARVCPCCFLSRSSRACVTGHDARGGRDGLRRGRECVLVGNERTNDKS